MPHRVRPNASVAPRRYPIATASTTVDGATGRMAAAINPAAITRIHLVRMRSSRVLARAKALPEPDPLIQAGICPFTGL
jgi:hypothetical protein